MNDYLITNLPHSLLCSSVHRHIHHHITSSPNSAATYSDITALPYGAILPPPRPLSCCCYFPLPPSPDYFFLFPARPNHPPRPSNPILPLVQPSPPPYFPLQSNLLRPNPPFRCFRVSSPASVGRDSVKSPKSQVPP